MHQGENFPFDKFVIHRFTSNHHKSGKGFQMRYQSSEKFPERIIRMGEQGACGGIFSFPYGMFSSPSYPDKYPHNVDCIYTITQPAGTVIKLNFIVVGIQPTYFSADHYTCPDYIEIRDGLSEDSQLLLNLCGYDIPAPIQSSKNHMWIKLVLIK